jgi:hypothetical protein
MSLTNSALYGEYQAPYLGADMMNPTATSSTDWGAVLSGGIVGAAQGAISQMVGGAYASGQLVPPIQSGAALAQQQKGQMMTLLLVCGLVYAVTR